MAMQKLLLSDDYLSDADIKHLLMDETAFGTNNVHGGGLMSSQPISDKPTIELLNHQNGCIPRHNHPKPVLGQIGLSQRVTEYQKTVCSSNKVTIHRMETHPMCQGNVRVTEIVRDHVVTTISTRERVFISNNRVVFPNQPILRNQNPVLDPCHQTPPIGPRPSNFSNFNELQSKNNGGISSSPFHAPFSETKDQAILPNDRLNPKSRELRLPKSKAPPPVHQAFSSHQPKNHGPYTCRKCRETFITAQCYATHVASHYRSEILAERLKRQASTCHQNIHFAQSSYRPVVVPGQSLNPAQSNRQPIVVPGQSLHLAQSSCRPVVVPGQSLETTDKTRGVSFEGHISSQKQKVIVKTEAVVKKE